MIQQESSTDMLKKEKQTDKQAGLKRGYGLKHGLEAANTLSYIVSIWLDNTSKNPKSKW